MRPHWVLLPLLSALVGGAKSDLIRRQDDNTSVSESSESPATSTTEADDSTTSTTEETTSTTDTGSDEDTTVTVTTTVSADAETVSSRTTIVTTRTTTIVDTSTVFETTTVTSRDQATATETEYVTTTVFRNQKRNLDIWTLPLEPVQAPATAAPAPTAVRIEEYYEEMKEREAHPRNNVFKRDTITETETVTDGGDEATTIFESVTRTIITATTRRTTTTEVVTETEQADASTTITTTRTLTVTSATGQTGEVTETSEPSQSTAAGDGNNSGDGNDDSSDGLSTGAKAGIGAGAGVVGLAIIAGLAWFCIKRRRNAAKPDHDDMFGSSEVPVGGAAGGARPMSHQPSTATSYAPLREPVLPNVAAEGYRGTAMGDGRTGYAKPETYGAAYTRQSAHPPPSSVSPVSPGGYSHPNTNRTSTLIGSGHGGDQLPEHSSPADMNNSAYGRPISTSPGPRAAELGNEGHNAHWQTPGAAEMDSTPGGHQRVPPNVYEMPGPDQR